MENLNNNKYFTGTWCEIPSPYSANVIAKSGMDFVIIDLEHGVMNMETVQNMVFATQCENCMAIIRVPSIEESSILKALDTGANGIIITHVETLNDVNKIAEFAKFAPEGNRGYNPFIRAGNYGNVKNDYFTVQNKKTIIGVIIESLSALENIEEIASSKYVDICYIGQYDISVALGCPGDVSNEKVANAVRDSAKVINKHGKMAGCMVHSVEEALKAQKTGISFIVYGVETGLISKIYRNFCKELKEEQ